MDGLDTARSYFQDRDLVICAADRPRSTIYEWLNQAAVDTGVAWMRGANDGLTVNMFLHVPGQTSCFECEQRYGRVTHDWYGTMVDFARATLGDRTVNPCTAPVAGLIGSIAAHEAIKFLTGAAQRVTLNHKLTFELQTLSTHVGDGHRDPQCPACSHLWADSLAPRREEPCLT